MSLDLCNMPCPTSLQPSTFSEEQTGARIRRASGIPERHHHSSNLLAFPIVKTFRDQDLFCVFVLLS